MKTLNEFVIALVLTWLMVLGMSVVFISPTDALTVITKVKTKPLYVGTDNAFTVSDGN